MRKSLTSHAICRPAARVRHHPDQTLRSVEPRVDKVDRRRTVGRVHVGQRVRGHIPPENETDQSVADLLCHRCSLISLPSIAEVDSADERVGLVNHHDLFVVCPEVALHIRAGVWVS